MTDEVLYLTTLACEAVHEATFAHRGQWVALDQDPPWPDVSYCPTCGATYPDDLGIAVVAVHEAQTTRPSSDP